MFLNFVVSTVIFFSDESFFLSDIWFVIFGMIEWVNADYFPWTLLYSFSEKEDLESFKDETGISIDSLRNKMTYERKKQRIKTQKNLEKLNVSIFELLYKIHIWYIFFSANSSMRLTKILLLFLPLIPGGHSIWKRP